jgi:hypothetical protein
MTSLGQISKATVRLESDSSSSVLETSADEALPDLPTHTGDETPGDTSRPQDIGLDRWEDAADLPGVLSADSSQKEAPPAEPDASQLDVDHADAPLSSLDQQDSDVPPISTLDAGADVVDTAVPHDDAVRVPDVARPPSDGSIPNTLATDAAQPCSPGAQRCNGNTIESCSATLKWLAGQACEGATPYCRPATATCGCVPGNQRCDADGVVPEICEDGLWRRQPACSGLVSPTCSGNRCVLDDWRDRAPALVAYGQDKLGVFTALDGVDLLAKYRQAKAWTPSGFAWNPRHMPIEGSPQAVSWSDNTIQLFATQTDGSIAYETFKAGDIERAWDQDGQQPYWASLSHPASTLLIGHPGIAVCGPNCLDLVARGMDNGLYHRRWAGAWQPVRDWAAWLRLRRSWWRATAGNCSSRPSHPPAIFGSVKLM